MANRKGKSGNSDRFYFLWMLTTARKLKTLAFWKKSYDKPVKVKVLVAQLCLPLGDPMDCSSPGSSLHGILQVRLLEWVAISISRRSFQPRDWTQVYHITGRFFTIRATREVHDKPRQHIKKQRLDFANKSPSSQSYDFSSSHVRLWELDHKEGLASKN